MPLPGYSAPPTTDTNLIVGLSVFLSFFVFTFIACFCCQGCPLNRFYIRKRLNEGTVTCPSCRRQGHVPMVLSNENGLMATCASRDCQPMLLAPSGRGFAAPYSVCEAPDYRWPRTQTQPISQINVIFPSDDPPSYHESSLGADRLHPHSDSCAQPLRSCYKPEPEVDPCRVNTQNGAAGGSLFSALSTRGLAVLPPWCQEAELQLLADRGRSSRERSVETERTLDRTTVL